MPEVRYTFTGDTDRLSAATRNVGGSLRSAQKFALGLGAALAGAGVAAAGIFSSLRDIAKTQDEIAKLSQRFGVAVEDLSSLRLGAELAGTSMQSVATALRTVSKNALDASRGTGEAKVAFQELGLSVTKSDGSLKSSTDLLEDVADRFSKMEAGSRKAALAQNIFGRSGSELIPLLNQGRAGLRELREEADRLGITFTAEGAAKAEEFNDEITRLTFAFEGLRTKALAPLLPLVTGVIEKFTDATAGAGDLSGSVIHLGRSMLISVGSVTELLASVAEVPLALAKAQLSVATTTRDLALLAAASPFGPGRTVGLGVAAQAQRLISSTEEGIKVLGVFERTNLSVVDALVEFDKLLASVGSGLRRGTGGTDALTGALKALNAELVKLPQIIDQPRPRLFRPGERERRAAGLAPGRGEDLAAGLPVAGEAPPGISGPTPESITAAGIPGSEELRERLVQPWLDVGDGLDGAFAGIEARSQTFLDALKAMTDRGISISEQFQLAFAGSVGGALVQFGQNITKGGKSAIKQLAASFALIAAQIGAQMVTQGIAEIITGHAPPPFGPRPDLIAHGTLMTVVGAGLAIGGGAAAAALGGGGGGGGGGGFQDTNASPFQSQGPAPIDISGGQEIGGQAFAQLANGVNQLAGMIEAAPAHSVVTRAARQRRSLVPSQAFGEVPA